MNKKWWTIRVRSTENRWYPVEHFYDKQGRLHTTYLTTAEGFATKQEAYDEGCRHGISVYREDPKDYSPLNN
jgi:hypothetical protein